jgi:ABC-type antimicrobial peptide transport system permease subunit
VRWLRIARARLRAWFRRDVVADEIREELEFHLEKRTEDLTREGLPRDEARRLAARRLGNVVLLRDQGYDVRGGGLVESIAQDVRHGVRSLHHSPNFTGALGGLALVIAAMGIFGVLAYTTAQRTTEIGIRLALGATPAGIALMVLRGAAGLIAAGLALGAIAASQLAFLAEAFLFQIRPTDPRIFAGAIALLALVGLAAALVPARRAATVDPLVSLRES